MILLFCYNCWYTLCFHITFISKEKHHHIRLNHHNQSKITTNTIILLLILSYPSITRIHQILFLLFIDSHGYSIFSKTLIPLLLFLHILLNYGVYHNYPIWQSREVVVHYFRTPGLTEAATENLLRVSRKNISEKIEKIETEFCYNIQITSEFTDKQKTVCRYLQYVYFLGSGVVA